MNKIVGFRQYLKSENSYKDLKEIIKDRKSYFNSGQGFLTIIALCGENPFHFLNHNNLIDEVELYQYSAWEEKAEKVAAVYQKSRTNLDKVQIIHYSEKPEGLTYPLELLVEISKFMDFEHLAVSDSDFQLPYAEIRKTYDFHLQTCKNDEAVITYPRRKRRSLDAHDYPINRWAVEDLENMYIYLLSDLTVLNQKADFQSGLSVTNKMAHQKLSFKNVGSWIGNLHMAIQVIHNNGRLENNFLVETNIQNESTINFDIQCRKIEQLYKYYLIPLSNICLMASEHPDRYLMSDWTSGKSSEQIKKDIYSILAMYKEFLKNKE
jgi:hypothetical protein